MKFATILSIAFIAVPTLAISSEHYERNYNVAESDLYDREIVTELTREDFIDMFGRDVVEDLEGRSPLIFGAIRAGFRIGRLVYKAGRARKLFRRDLEFDEELEMREPIKGARTAIRLSRGSKKVASGDQPGKREVLEEREFDEDEMFEREFDDDEEYFEREFDDLD